MSPVVMASTFKGSTSPSYVLQLRNIALRAFSDFFNRMQAFSASMALLSPLLLSLFYSKFSMVPVMPKTYFPQVVSSDLNSDRWWKSFCLLVSSEVPTHSIYTV